MLLCDLSTECILPYLCLGFHPGLSNHSHVWQIPTVTLMLHSSCMDSFLYLWVMTLNPHLSTKHTSRLHQCLLVIPWGAWKLQWIPLIPQQTSSKSFMLIWHLQGKDPWKVPSQALPLLLLQPQKMRFSTSHMFLASRTLSSPRLHGRNSTAGFWFLMISFHQLVCGICWILTPDIWYVVPQL